MLAQDAKFTTTDLTPVIGTAVRNDVATHRAIPYSADSGRLLHRTILQGEEAFA